MADSSLAQLVEQLEGAEQALSGVEALDEQQAEGIAERMDRLASQLLEVSPPLAMATVHRDLGTRPASVEDFNELVGEMSPRDGEG